MARRFGLPRDLAISLQNLAVVHRVRDRLDRAEPLVREAFEGAVRDEELDAEPRSYARPKELLLWLLLQRGGGTRSGSGSSRRRGRR